MTSITRREALALAVGAAASAALPTASAPVQIDFGASQPITAWAVGTPGEFNWQYIVAPTYEEAKRIFKAEWVSDSCEDEGESPCGECEWCTLDVEAERKPMWDGLEATTAGDWLRAGMGALCSRCSYETFPEENGHAIGSEAVCEGCMTLADWETVDPERAAELRDHHQ